MDMKDPGSFKFCSTPLWDQNKTWDTLSTPDFSPCFHLTALEYAPLGVLLLLTPIELHLVGSNKDRQIPKSNVTCFRIIAIIAAAILPIVTFITNWVKDVEYLDIASVLSPVVRIISYFYTLALYLLNLKYGRVTSGTLFVYWMMETICGAFTLASLFHGDLEEIIGPHAAIIFVVEYAMVIIIFFLNFLPDSPPRYKYMEGM